MTRWSRCAPTAGPAPPTPRRAATCRSPTKNRGARKAPAAPARATPNSPLWCGGAVVFGPKPARLFEKSEPTRPEARLRAALERAHPRRRRPPRRGIRRGRRQDQELCQTARRPDRRHARCWSSPARFDEKTYLAARNHGATQLATARDVNVEQLLNYHKIIVTGDALAGARTTDRRLTHAKRSATSSKRSGSAKRPLSSAKRTTSTFSKSIRRRTSRRSRRLCSAIFGKKVVGVNTANYAGKARRQRTPNAGRTAHWKKAIVRLAPGEKIDLA